MYITHLVLSSGGLKGFCYLGILYYLYNEKLDKNIKNVAGTSIGAYFSLIFALKIPLHEVENILKNIIEMNNSSNIDKDELINMFYKNGLDSIIKYINLLKKYTNDEDLTFIELSKRNGINLYVNATNINDNNDVIFSTETTPNISVFDAVAASMSVPFLFTPIEINEEYYIDGAIKNSFIIDIFNKVPKKNILGILIRIDDDFSINKIEKNTKISFIDYIYHIITMLYIGFKNNTYNNYYNSDKNANILIIKDMKKINNFYDINIEDNKIKKK